jgi:hypothetical protein
MAASLCNLLTARGDGWDSFILELQSRIKHHEYVSATDMKIEIEISDALQFRLVVHISRLQRPAQRRLLDLIKSWLGKSGQRDKWSFCLIAAMMTANRRDNEQTTAPEPHTGIQVEGGSGRHQG